MTLKEVPKPASFELNDKRANQSKDAGDWLPEDALYDAFLDMKEKPPAGAMVIAWFVKTDTEALALRSRFWSNSMSDGLALSAILYDNCMDMCRPDRGTK